MFNWLKGRLFLTMLASPTLRPLVRGFGVHIQTAQDVTMDPGFGTATICAVDRFRAALFVWSNNDVQLILTSPTEVAAKIGPTYDGSPVRFTVFEFTPPRETT